MFRNFFLVLASVIVCCLLGEAALRIADIGFPVFYQPDEELGFALHPGAEGRYRKEGGSTVVINSFGRRDPGYTAVKSSGTYRVALLGDSFVLGLPVDEKKGIASQLEIALRSCPALAHRRIEVLNFGAAGYGTAQELILLRTRVWAYSPDAVILAFFAGNDVRNNSRALQRDPVRPYFTLENGELKLDASFRDSASYKFRSSILGSFFYDVVNHVRIIQLINELRARRESIDGGVGHAPAEKNFEGGLDTEIYAPPRSNDWQSAWKVTEALIATMAREVKARSAKFLLATIGTSAEVLPDQSKRKALLHDIGAVDFSYPDARLAALANKDHFDMIPLAPAMRAEAERSGTFFYGFANTKLGTGHFNELGDAKAAALVAQAHCRQLQQLSPPH